TQSDAERQTVAMLCDSAIIPALTTKHPLLKVDIQGCFSGGFSALALSKADDGVTVQQIVETYPWVSTARTEILKCVPKLPTVMMSCGTVSLVTGFAISTFPELMHAMAEEMEIHAPELLAWCIRRSNFGYQEYQLVWEVTEEEEKVPVGVREDCILVKGMARATEAGGDRNQS
ncbi:hypothetical protein HK104_007198, partial [Borealophlyctis nickersoniae]